MRASRSLISWSLYDWASSPVPTLHATFIFSVYFTTAVMPDGGTAAWAWMTSATALAVAVAARFWDGLPTGTMAESLPRDRHRHRRGGDGGAVVRASGPALCADGAGAVGGVDFRNGDRLRLL